MSDVVTQFIDAAKAQQQSASDNLQTLRRAGLESFETKGLPDLRNEHWKYTDLRRLGKHQFNLANEAALNAADIDALRFNDLDCYEAVFYNGTYQPQLSSLAALSEGVIIQPLAEALQHHGDEISAAMTQEDTPRSYSFMALNSSFLHQGVFIKLADKQVIDKPVNLLYISSADNNNVMSQPRNVIVLGQSAAATIIESYIGLDDSVYFTNTVTDLLLHENSHCQHYKLQQESHKAFHIGSLNVQQKRSSHLVSHSVALGASLARNDLHCSLTEPDSAIEMNGLYLANGKQHIDNHTVVDHLVPHTRSDQIYRGVLNEQGRAVFNGKVVVHQDAQKTEAHQSNANLLLSNHAEVDTKPELEIYADDVKCSHGATVGQLDQNMLFYLRSRAIDETTARSLLTYAFAEEVISQIDLAPIRQRLERLIMGKLPDTDVIREFAHDE